MIFEGGFAIDQWRRALMTVTVRIFGGHSKTQKKTNKQNNNNWNHGGFDIVFQYVVEKTSVAFSVSKSGFVRRLLNEFRRCSSPCLEGIRSISSKLLAFCSVSKTWVSLSVSSDDHFHRFHEWMANFKLVHQHQCDVIHDATTVTWFFFSISLFSCSVMASFRSLHSPMRFCRSFQWHWISYIVSSRRKERRRLADSWAGKKFRRGRIPQRMIPATNRKRFSRKENKKKIQKKKLDQQKRRSTHRVLFSFLFDYRVS